MSFGVVHQEHLGLGPPGGSSINRRHSLSHDFPASARQQFEQTPHLHSNMDTSLFTNASMDPRRSSYHEGFSGYSTQDSFNYGLHAHQMSQFAPPSYAMMLSPQQQPFSMDPHTQGVYSQSPHALPHPYAQTHPMLSGGYPIMAILPTSMAPPASNVHMASKTGAAPTDWAAPVVIFAGREEPEETPSPMALCSPYDVSPMLASPWGFSPAGLIYPAYMLPHSESAPAPTHFPAQFSNPHPHPQHPSPLSHPHPSLPQSAPIPASASFVPNPAYTPAVARGPDASRGGRGHPAIARLSAASVLSMSVHPLTLEEKIARWTAVTDFLAAPEESCSSDSDDYRPVSAQPPAPAPLSARPVSRHATMAGSTQASLRAYASPRHTGFRPVSDGSLGGGYVEGPDGLAHFVPAALPGVVQVGRFRAPPLISPAQAQRLLTNEFV